MTVSPDLASKVSNDLRTISETLMRISRGLHEHAQKLERAVEGTYARESSDPRIRLLSDSLHLSRLDDLELGRLSQSLQRVLQLVQGQTDVPAQQAAVGTATPFERERQALNSSINILKRERNELETLYDIARVLNSTLEFDQVLRLVMEQVIQFVNAERGFLALINPMTNELDFTIALDKQGQTIDRSAYRNSRGTVIRVVKTREPILTDDAQIDDAFKEQESIMAYGIRSIMCAPLVVRDHCIGAVYVDSRINANLFGPKHRELLLAFCHQAAIAIDNARLFADLTRTIRQVNEDKQYMDNIFASIANGVITTDSSGIVTTFNGAAAKTLRMDPKSAIGMHHRDVFAARPQVGISELLQNARVQHEHGTMVTNSVDCDIPGAGEVNLNLYVSALLDTQNNHIGIALVIDDRTELKRSEAQAKQVRRIFERYVHPNVVQQLIKDPMALNLGGETKEISVVFADIRGYTRLSESMAPEEMMNLLNSYLGIMVEEIWYQEGTLTAFIGDALMAIFNAPLLQEDHALRAVRAAWNMRRAVQKYQQDHPQEIPLAFGFGVNTGLGVVGNLGSTGRLQNYTAIGDVVNVAARLQSNASDNNILLNHATFLQVRQYVMASHLAALQVKNKSAPLEVWSLLGLV
ncbi:MAG: GAF domain-containing protein [Chloroflexota bacterium]|nr:MAG: GAF domain-containing protein [Chloroflexota bacterium]